MVHLGYMRIEKGDDSQQRDALIQAGVAGDAIYQDRHSRASHTHHPGLRACMQALSENDTLVVWKLDRLGSSLLHLARTIRTLEKRGIGFRVLAGAHMDMSTTPSGRMMFGFFALVGELEMELFPGSSSNRGRPSKMTKAKLERAQKALANRDGDVRSLVVELGMTRPTLYRYVAPSGELRSPGRRVR